MLVDVDDTIIEVHGYAKQGAGFGYTRVRGLNALLATATTPGSAPVVVAQRLRKGSAGSPRGAARLVADALTTVRAMTTATPLLRADSAYYGHATAAAALRAGAEVSITVRSDPKVRAAIAAIDEAAWTPIEYREAVFDEAAGMWVSRAEVAEIPYLAFAAQKKTNRVPGRLVVRRIPDVNAKAKVAAGQGTLFDLWRFHAFFTTVPADVMDTVTADKTHRGHAVIEQVHADLKNSALAHLPSGKFAANAAWLVLAVIAFNLTRAAATLTGPTLAKATTATIRRRLVHVPARTARRARRLTLHLPDGLALAPRMATSPRPCQRPTTPSRDDLTTQPRRARPRTPWNTLTARPGSSSRPHPLTRPRSQTPPTTPAHRWIEAKHPADTARGVAPNRADAR